MPRVERAHPVVHLGLLAVVLLMSSPAAAHEVGVSKGTYQTRADALDVEWVLAQRELAAAVPGLDPDGDATLTEAELLAGGPAIAELATGLVVTTDGRPCAGSLAAPARLFERDGVVLNTVHRCASALGTVHLDLRLLERLAPGHRHLGQLLTAAGASSFVLRRDAPGFEFDAVRASSAAPPQGTFGEMFTFGVEHILTGYDHLLFLFGLIVVGGRLRSVLAVVTAFTVAHSITLALAALDVWRPNPGFIEPAIALSIAYVGVENFFVRDIRGRWRITFPFGLVHGFGFGGLLVELGLPTDRVASSLLGFNLGVEAGQLAVVALALPLLRALRGFPSFQRVGVPALSALVVVAGIGWFIQRVA